MIKRAPADVGMTLTEIDTPALLIDLEIFESNLNQMADNAKSLGVRLRPHAKMHKSADVAQAQIARGAVGVCCQKVSEAECLIDAGIHNILITNQVVGKRKLDLFVELSMRSELTICVDNAQNISDLNACAASRNTKVGVLVEVDVGGERCGVPSGEPTLELATQITQSLNLKFLGLQAYKGTAQNQREFGDRENASSVISGYLKETIELLKEHGITCKNVTGAGTGTWQFEGASNIFTELQPGSYAFMDADYARNKNSDGKTASEFGHSLFVYTTVMSAVHSDYVVVDAGLKSLAFDAGMPLVADDWTVNYHTPSDEHGVLDLSNSTRRYALGKKVRLIPGHCDPTVNLHDWYIGVRGDLVESVWTVTARGAVF